MKSFLTAQASEFRHGYQVKNDTGPASREMQKRLIVEEFKEFLEAEQQLIYGFTRNAEDCLKELADLVYVCYQYAANLNWDLDEAMDVIKKKEIIAVLAHTAAGSFPGEGHYKEVLPSLEIVKRILPEFILAGIKGLEVYYPGHTREHQDLMKSWVKTH